MTAHPHFATDARLGSIRWLVFGCVDPLLCGGASSVRKRSARRQDNDSDGMIDFPTTRLHQQRRHEDAAAPQCNDGRDNDGDGKIDFPYDPGCFAPNQDDETDDCPDGPNCPQCANGKDDDMNGTTDYPDDPGCSAGLRQRRVHEQPARVRRAGARSSTLPIDGHATGMLMRQQRRT